MIPFPPRNKRDSNNFWARVIVDDTLDVINGSSSKSMDVVLTNAFRLAEVYRCVDPRFDVVERFTEVRRAMDGAKKDAYPHLDKEQAMQSLCNVFRGLVQPDKLPRPSVEDIDTSRYFFTCLKVNLEDYYPSQKFMG